MNIAYKNFIAHTVNDPSYACPICGNRRYVTDQGNHELTMHCSSAEARFWDYPRGSAEELAARRHWDLSRKDIFLSVEDVLQFLVKEELQQKM